jgi:hypothetical protein
VSTAGSAPKFYHSVTFLPFTKADFGWLINRNKFSSLLGFYQNIVGHKSKTGRHVLNFKSVLSMKNLLSIALLFLSLTTISSYAQTTKKTPAPVKKTVAKKPVAKKPTEQEKAAKAAAIAKTKQDSIDAVNALAMKLARQIIVEDSIRKAEAAEKLAAEEKLKQEQLLAEEQKLKQEKAGKEKSKKEPKTKQQKVAAAKPEKKTKEPVKRVPDELKPTAKPVVESSDPKTWIGLRASGVGSFALDEEDMDPYFGYGGGLVANFALGKHFSFQPEVLYTREGLTYKSAEQKVSAFANIIQVPLLLKYSFGESNRGLFVNVGPYGNYIINGVINFGSEKMTEKPEKTIIDYGVAGGLGVAIPAGPGRLLIEARGTYYLGSTEKTDESIKFLTGVVSVGYLFPIGR